MINGDTRSGEVMERLVAKLVASFSKILRGVDTIQMGLFLT
jgi:hypothetical protein